MNATIYAALPYERPRPWGAPFDSRKEAISHAQRMHEEYPWMVFVVRSDDRPEHHIIPPGR